MEMSGKGTLFHREHRTHSREATVTSEQRVRAHFSEENGRGWLYSPATNTELWTFRRTAKQEVKSHQNQRPSMLQGYLARVL